MMMKCIVLMAALLVPFMMGADKGLSASSPAWVLDMSDKAVLPHRFRVASQALPSGSGVSEQGLHSLPIAGTAQFSEQALLTITRHFTPPFTIIDLRQESHGFINGNAVTWLNSEDNVNQGKTSQQIEATEAYLLNRLKMLNNTIIQVKLKKDSYSYSRLRIKNIASEKELAMKYGLAYKRFYVTDHFAPDDDTVDEFISFVKTLSPQHKLLFHCRGGAGRTTTFMAMFDMMHNAKLVSFEDILKRQYLLGGENLLSLPAANTYKYYPAKRRLAFLKGFYHYCLNNQDNYKTGWRDWLESKK